MCGFAQIRPTRNRLRCVPTHVLRTILHREFPEESTQSLADQIGFDEKNLRRMLNPDAHEHTYWTNFEKADRILTNLGLHHLWHVEPGLIEVCRYLDSFELAVAA